MPQGYKIQYAGHFIPTEHTIDGDDETTRDIHGTIGKGISGQNEIASGVLTANVVEYEHVTTTSYVTLSTIIGSTVTGIDLLYIEILEVADRAFPQVYYRLNGTEVGKLTAVMDFSLLRLKAYSSDDIAFKSAEAGERLEILVGKEI
jgi:hypothetical protein